MDSRAPILDAVDRFLLDRLQRELPLTERPFRTIAEECPSPAREEPSRRRRAAGGEGPNAVLPAAGVSEAEVLARLEQLKHRKLIRRIGAVMNSRALGYTGTLCGVIVAPDALESVAAAVGAYAGVTHNYEREDRFNLWFTLLARDRETVAQVVSEVSAQAGVRRLVELPMEREYKIHVQFRLVEKGPSGAAASSAPQPGGDCPRARKAPPAPGARERAIIRAVQDDLPLEARPYAVLARRCDAAGHPLGEAQLLEELRRFCSLGYIRRIGAALSHRSAGYRGNAMVVWRVPPAICDEIGRRVAAYEEVSHCYRRRPAAGWPYNLYAMVHARSREECSERIARLTAAAGGHPHRVLASLREFKKSSMRYFCEENANA